MSCNSCNSEQDLNNNIVYLYPNKKYNLKSKLILNGVFYSNVILELIINNENNGSYSYIATFIFNDIKNIKLNSICGLGFYNHDGSFSSNENGHNFEQKKK